jgi:hypothetical protein
MVRGVIIALNKILKEEEMVSQIIFNQESMEIEA